MTRSACQPLFRRRPTRAGAGVAMRHCLLTLALLLAMPIAAQPNFGASAGQPFGKPGGTPSFDNTTQPQFLPVEEAYPLAVESQGDRELRLVWQMPPGYYLYQHAFRFEITRDGQTRDLEADFPPAITREDEFFGVVQVYYDAVDLTLDSVLPLAGATVSVTSQGCADAGLCYPPRTQRFRFDSTGAAAEIAAATPRAAQPTVDSRKATVTRMALMALFAFLGGAILNLMPCVLPILSLKALSFASCEPLERHRHGWYYSAGVVASFLAVATVLIALRGAGQVIGWGFQLQSPGFVIALAYLFTLMGLSLSGLVNAGGGLMNLGSDLADQGGKRGSFFTGVLAVVVASPCTAPFMGTALGFALTQSTPLALAIFAALGAGMATPLLLLSYSEWARRRLPRPGAWMETLKQALAFPLYATALWLFWVAGRQAGVDFMAAALLGALLLALALWLWRGRAVSRGIAVICVVGAVAIALWRPAVGPDEASHLPEGAVPYSADQLTRMRGAGTPVFVDVTADWCITCLANEKAVLASTSVQEAFTRHQVTYMVADWTDYDAEIADFVASHGRSGIPLYVLYAGDGVTPPLVLPQILRASTLIEALGRVGAKPQQVARNEGISR